MQRNAYIVSYDIADDSRRTAVYDTCRGYGERIQYSVFMCHMTPTERLDLQSRLRDTIHMHDDQVLFIDLGPVDGRARRCITALGRLHCPPSDDPVIL